LLISGTDASNNPIANLYSNNGSGSFVLVEGTDFTAVDQSSIAFADIDGDNDQDVLLAGFNISNVSDTKLYINDGNGDFVNASGSAFLGLQKGSAAFVDINGDNDKDIFISGLNNSNENKSLLYGNSGTGHFSLISGTPFDNTSYGSISIADIDGDNDKDVLITGVNTSGLRIAKLYKNNGSGSFTLVAGTPFDGVYSGSSAFADIDGDTDQDVLITGRNSLNQKISKLYRNDGNGNFSVISGTPFDGVYRSSIAFVDIDGDNDQDVLITGANASNQKKANLYRNDGSGNFSLEAGTPFDGVHYSSVAFADLDGDTDKDLLITGKNSANETISKLYRNNGNGSFSLIAGTPFDGVYNSSVAFTDIDNDGDNDVLITGQKSSSDPISKLYINNGNAIFSLLENTPFDGVYYSSVVFSDVDGDNNQDLLINGLNESNQVITKLYRNTTSSIETESQADGDWVNISWSNGIPNSNLYKAKISHQITLNQNLSISNLTIHEDSKLTSNNQITISEDVLLKSNASLKGQEHLNIGGDVIIEREITGYSNSSNGWHFLSSPVNSQTIAGSDFVPTSESDDLYQWGESTGEWLNYFGSNFSETEFEVGKGYLAAYSSTITKEFNGSFNTGTVTKNLTYNDGFGDGWNLLGNPYPSAIDWDLITRSGDVDGSVYIVNPTDGTYLVWNGTAGDFANGEIAVNQGFFVKANSGGQSVTMELADQVHSENTFNKSSKETPPNSLKISLKGENSNNNTYLQFREDASQDFDSQTDAYKLFGFAEIAQVYTELEDEIYSINCLNYSPEPMSIPLGVYLNSEEDLTLEFSQLESFDGLVKIELEDKSTEDFIDLRTLSNYSFRGSVSDEADRFLLHFSNVTGIEEQENLDIQVYSAGQAIYIQNPNSIHAELMVYNANGQLLYSTKTTGSTLQKIEEPFAKGVYLVNIKSNKQVQTEKIIIQ